ncbi:hypothetical protein SADUNF_Sadunf09G0103500 [Salix dunnii]|uniref:Uncharacterized protein n=1 Tax=Salix dunnii TaxID=1413687 RepID=A0A835N098_9ROSI|nr:hypothetical protein SADUNF_Sadunf09G0103500 [Salix dunnii]
MAVGGTREGIGNPRRADDPGWGTREFGGQSNMAFMCYKKGKVIINYKENTSVSWLSEALHSSENGGPLQSPIFFVRSLNQSNSQNMKHYTSVLDNLIDKFANLTGKGTITSIIMRSFRDRHLHPLVKIAIIVEYKLEFETEAYALLRKHLTQMIKQQFNY